VLPSPGPRHAVAPERDMSYVEHEFEIIVSTG